MFIDIINKPNRKKIVYLRLNNSKKDNKDEKKNLLI